VTDVLEKIAGDWPQREIDRLLPDRWVVRTQYSAALISAQVPEPHLLVRRR